MQGSIQDMGNPESCKITKNSFNHEEVDLHMSPPIYPHLGKNEWANVCEEAF